MARECQEKNAKGLTMVAVGMNKAAEELMILDERTQEDLAVANDRPIDVVAGEILSWLGWQ